MCQEHNNEQFVNVELEILEQSLDNRERKINEKDNVKISKQSNNTEVEIPEECDKEEIDDPDVPKNLASLLYCTKKLEKFNLAVQNTIKNGAPISKQFKDKVMMFQKKKNEIETAISNEQITFEQYSESLETSLAHDKILLVYFTAIKDDIKANIVKFRIECTQKEINNEVDENEVENE